MRKLNQDAASSLFPILIGTVVMMVPFGAMVHVSIHAGTEATERGSDAKLATIASSLLERMMKPSEGGYDKDDDPCSAAQGTAQQFDGEQENPFNPSTVSRFGLGLDPECDDVFGKGARNVLDYNVLATAADWGQTGEVCFEFDYACNDPPLDASIDGNPLSDLDAFRLVRSATDTCPTDDPSLCEEVPTPRDALYEKAIETLGLADSGISFHLTGAPVLRETDELLATGHGSSHARALLIGQGEQEEYYTYGPRQEYQCVQKGAEPDFEDDVCVVKDKTTKCIVDDGPGPGHFYCQWHAEKTTHTRLILSPEDALACATLDALVSRFDCRVRDVSMGHPALPASESGSVAIAEAASLSIELPEALTDGVGTPTLEKFNTVVVPGCVDDATMSTLTTGGTLMDWVETAGGYLVLLGCDDHDVTWPLARAGIHLASDAGAASAPMPDHALLTQPNELAWQGYGSASKSWRTTDFDADEYRPIVSGSPGEHALESTPGSFGAGRIVATAWMLRSLTTPHQDAECDVGQIVATCEALRLMHNVLSLDYRNLYIELGQPCPDDERVEAAHRVATTWVPRLGDVVDVRLTLCVWDDPPLLPPASVYEDPPEDAGDAPPSFDAVSLECEALPANVPLAGCQRWASNTTYDVNSQMYPEQVIGNQDGTLVYAAGWMIHYDLVEKKYANWLFVSALNAHTGAPLWVATYDHKELGRSFGFDLALSSDESIVYVAGAAQASATSWRTDGVLVAFNSLTSAQLWAASYDGAARGDDEFVRVMTSGHGNSNPAPQASVVYVVGSSTSAQGRDVYVGAYDGALGLPLWEFEYDAGGTERSVDGALTPDGKRIIALTHVTGAIGEPAPRLVAVSTTTGNLDWVATHDGANAAAWGAGVVIDHDSKRVFVVVGEARSSNPSWGSYTLRTLAYDASKGTQLWSQAHSPGGRIDAHDVVVAADSKTVYALGLTDSWSRSASAAVVVAYASQDGSLAWQNEAPGLGIWDGGRATLAVDPAGARVVVGAAYSYEPPCTCYTYSEGESEVEISMGSNQGLAAASFDAITGVREWTRTATTGSTADLPSKIVVTADSSSAILPGAGAITLDSPMFTAAWNADGALLPGGLQNGPPGNSGPNLPGLVNGPEGVESRGVNAGNGGAGARVN